MLERVATSLRLRLDSAQDNSKRHKAPKVSSSAKCSTSKAILLAKPRPLAKPADVSTVNDNNGNLLDLDEKPATTSREQENKLALALFQGAETRVNTTWESFSPCIAQNGSTSSNGGQAVETNRGVMGWELALIELESHLSRPISRSLAGGFDQSLLCSLHDQDVANQELQAASFYRVGSASSVPMLPFWQSNFLALLVAKAKKGYMDEDPFVASINVPLPAYVQMAELRKKHQFFMEEQPQWLQYQQGRIYGYGGVPMNYASNSFLVPFQPTSYPVPSYGVNPNYG